MHELCTHTNRLHRQQKKEFSHRSNSWGTDGAKITKFCCRNGYVFLSFHQSWGHGINNLASRTNTWHAVQLELLSNHLEQHMTGTVVPQQAWTNALLFNTVNGFVWSNKATIWMKSYSMIWFLVMEYHSLFRIAKYDICWFPSPVNSTCTQLSTLYCHRFHSWKDSWRKPNLHQTTICKFLPIPQGLEKLEMQYHLYKLTIVDYHKMYAFKAVLF